MAQHHDLHSEHRSEESQEVQRERVTMGVLVGIGVLVIALAAGISLRTWQVARAESAPPTSGHGISTIERGLSASVASARLDSRFTVTASGLAPGTVYDVFVQTTQYPDGTGVSGTMARIIGEATTDADGGFTATVRFDADRFAADEGRSPVYRVEVGQKFVLPPGAGSDTNVSPGEAEVDVALAA